ncbi:acyl carrier protein [Legionella septentrionalis]|uniref:acyl carrier protein n=1 Tax=Legionella septentrionalis TaxID=2498109 RepID=UPI000F8D3D95|nr:acyl carrier protein [Legionella septentrionalis]RUQ94628.1 acyl carrier protein [Legionella septentrionalis]
MQYYDISQKLMNFINSALLNDVNSGLTEDSPLLELGVINSLQTIQLVVFIKKEFNCLIPDEEINLDNFRSVKSLANLILSCAVNG